MYTVTQTPPDPCTPARRALTHTQHIYMCRCVHTMLNKVQRTSVQICPVPHLSKTSLSYMPFSLARRPLPASTTLCVFTSHLAQLSRTSPKLIFIPVPATRTYNLPGAWLVPTSNTLAIRLSSITSHILTLQPPPAPAGPGQ